MKTKSEIVRDWLPRYTGRSLEEFGKFIILSNFIKYVELFAEHFGVEVDRPRSSHAVGHGRELDDPQFRDGQRGLAATVMDLLASRVTPRQSCFWGNAADSKNSKVGDFILPIAAIHGEGASNDYMPKRDSRPSRPSASRSRSRP